LRRQRNDRDRSANRYQKKGDRREQQRRRDVTTESAAGTHRVFDQQQARVPEGEFFSPAQHEEVQRYQRRDNEQNPE
jgi:hypothetical protein